MKDLSIDFTKGAESVMVDDAMAIQANLGIAICVNDGISIKFQYERGERRGQAAHYQRG